MTEWPLYPLDDIADVSGGNPAPQAPHHFSHDGHPFVRMQDVGRKHIDPSLTETADHITDDAVRECGLRLFPEGTLLIPKSGASVNLNHRALLGRAAFVVSHLATIVPDQRRVLPSFLFHWSQHYDPRSQAQVTSLPSLPLSLIKEARVPLPPLDEQRRIVRLLDRAAEIQRRADAARAKARTIIPALFLDMFGDPANTWPLLTIEEALASTENAIRTGPFGSHLKHSEFTDSGIPVLGIDNAVDNEFKWGKPRHLPPERYKAFRRFRVFPGDVIITIMGTTGRVCVTPGDLPECMSTKHLCTFTLDRARVHPRYVWGALLFDPSVRSQARSKGNGQIMEGWNMGIVRSIRFSLPPLSLQTAFAEQVARIESVARALDAAAAKAEAMAAALSAEVFG